MRHYHSRKLISIQWTWILIIQITLNATMAKGKISSHLKMDLKEFMRNLTNKKITHQLAVHVGLLCNAMVTSLNHSHLKCVAMKVPAHNLN